MKSKPWRLREGERGSGEAIERRLLVVIRVVAVHDPVQTRNADGRSEARVGCVFVDEAGVVGEAQAEIERQPVRCFVLIFEEQGF